MDSESDSLVPSSLVQDLSSIKSTLEVKVKALESENITLGSKILDLEQPNLDIIKENALLRQDIHKLKHKLASHMGSDFTDWVKCLYSEDPDYTPVNQAREQVDRILHTPKNTPVFTISQGLQTDIDPKMDALELKVVELREVIKEKSDQIGLERAINRQHLQSMEQIRIETLSLEKTFAKIENDAHIAQVSERLAQSALSESEHKVGQLQKENTFLQEKLLESKKLIAQHEKAALVASDMSQKSSFIDTNMLRFPDSDNLDPVALLEYQWMVDRERFGMEIEVYKNRIAKLEIETNGLKKELKQRLTTKNSIASDELRQKMDEIEKKDSQLALLTAEITKAKAQAQIRIRTIKDCRERIKRNDEENEKRELMVSEMREQIMNLTKSNDQLDSKVKTFTSLAVGKAALVKNIKSRLELLQGYATESKSIEESLAETQKELKTVKLELQRKTELMKNWKLKFEGLEHQMFAKEKPIKKPESNHTVQIFNEHVKKTQQKTLELERFLKKYGEREKQFIRVLERVLYILRKPSVSEFGATGDLDPTLVQQAAQKFSKQFLNMDWEFVVQSTKIPSPTECADKMHKLLQADQFEDSVLSLILMVTT